MKARATLLALYTASLLVGHARVPGGLCNDTAEDALRAIRLVESGAFEVLTYYDQDRLAAPLPMPGRFAHTGETLYLYLQGWIIAALGPTRLAVEVASWPFALACIVLLSLVGRRVDPFMPPWLPLAVGASSIWLFHYGRAGGRPISAPFFLLAVTGLLARGEERPERRLTAFACGVVLALSVYSYTACRILPVTMALFVGLRLAGTADGRRARARGYGWMLAGAAITSIPNFLFLMHSGLDLLRRGAYVLPAGPAAMARNLWWSALLPFHFPEDYRLIAGFTPFFSVDGVSTGLTAAGIDPVHPLIAVGIVLGVLPSWRRRREPGVLFLLCAWLVGTLLLGLSGPSLTRFLILLPVYLMVAALGMAEAMRRHPGLRSMVALGLTVVVATHGYAYVVRFASAPLSQAHFSPAATPIGERGRAVAATGRPVLCIVSRDASVVQFLTHDQTDRVRIAEFYRQPFDPRRLPLGDFRPEVLLFEKTEVFRDVILGFRQEWRRESHLRFTEIWLP